MRMGEIGDKEVGRGHGGNEQYQTFNSLRNFFVAVSCY